MATTSNNTNTRVAGEPIDAGRIDWSQFMPPSPTDVMNKVLIVLGIGTLLAGIVTVTYLLTRKRKGKYE